MEKIYGSTQPNNSLEIDTTIPFFSLLSGKYFYLNPYVNPIMTYLGESIVKLDLTVRDCITGQPTGRRVLGLTTNNVNNVRFSYLQVMEYCTKTSQKAVMDATFRVIDYYNTLIE